MMRGRLSLTAGEGGFAAGVSAAGAELAGPDVFSCFAVLSAWQPRRKSVRAARIAVDAVLRMSTRYQIHKGTRLFPTERPDRREENQSAAESVSNSRWEGERPS